MERILIVKLGALGDVVQSLPVLSTLRTCFPKSYIGWVVEEAAVPILQGHPDLDDLILLERKRLKGFKAISYVRQWIRLLREKRFDAAFDLHNLLKSGIITYVSGASIRVGFRKIREGNFIFMNRWIKPGLIHQHAVEKYLSLLSPLGIDETQWVHRFPLFWHSKDEVVIERFLEMSGLSQKDALVAINPCANWLSKRWKYDRYAAVADGLAKENGVGIVILWGPGEFPLAEAVLNAMSEKATIAPQTSIKEFMALIKRCRLLISGDSGPLHIAAALGVPTVSLYGPSDPRRNGPYGEGHIVIQSSVSPAKHWQIKERGNRWMETIAMERVLEASNKQLLAGAGKNKG